MRKQTKIAMTIIKVVFILSAMLQGLTTASDAKSSIAVGKNKQPNILFIFTDDQRWDALGHAGNSVIETPNLDKLAAQGTYFDKAFVTTPICAVSRASVLTGQYAKSSGVDDFSTSINLHASYPRYLQEGGYYTGFIGKWGTNDNDKAYFKQSADLFDYWGGSMVQSNFWHEADCNYVRNNGTSEKHNFYCDCPPDARGKSGEEVRIGKANIKKPVHLETKIIPKKVNQFLDQRNKDKPFSLSISYKSPHAPMADYDDMFKGKYDGIAMPIAESVNEKETMSQPDFLRNSLNGFKNIKMIRDAHKIKGGLQKKIRNYYRLINGVDNSVGQIVSELKSRGLYDNTVIIFYSDNGYFMEEHGFHGKWLLYEESIRVPGFIFDPRAIKNKARTQEMVLNIDLAPTILDLAGLDIPEHMEGKSLLALHDDPTAKIRNDIFLEHHFANRPGKNHIERSEGIRTKDWKYIRYIDQTGDEMEELYHVEKDPLELNDLSGHAESASKLHDLRDRYLAYLDEFQKSK